jgi:hypothetical protein
MDSLADQLRRAALDADEAVGELLAAIEAAAAAGVTVPPETRERARRSQRAIRRILSALAPSIQSH